MLKIYLSPSTQENNRGLSPFGTEEAGMNKIADHLVPLLVKDGRFEVKRNSISMSPHQCAYDSNDFKADIHVAIHSNAGGGQGTEVYAYGPNTNSEKLSKALYNQIAPLSPGADRGIKYNNNFIEVGDTVKATSCLIELAFHDNKDDAAWLANNPPQIAQALYKGICDYFGYNHKALDVAPPVCHPTASTLILGAETTTVEQCNQYIRKVNPNAPDIVPLYKKYGELLGIKWGYAVAQAIKETGYFRYTGDVKPEQNNYAGMGAVGGGAKGAVFMTPEQGVIAHLQHLFAYASTQSLPMPIVDPRFSLVSKGACQTWESLNGRWAVPGVGYGEDIVSIHDAILKEQVVQPDKTEQAISLLEQVIRLLKG